MTEISALANSSTTPPSGTVTVTLGPPRSVGVLEVVELVELTAPDLIRLTFCELTAAL